MTLPGVPDLTELERDLGLFGQARGFQETLCASRTLTRTYERLAAVHEEETILGLLTEQQRQDISTAYNFE